MTRQDGHREGRNDEAFQAEGVLVPACSGVSTFSSQGVPVQWNLSVAEFSGIAYICVLRNIIGVVAQFG